MTTTPPDGPDAPAEVPPRTAAARVRRPAADPGFDRLRRRPPATADEPGPVTDAIRDQEGKRALFSAADLAEATPAFGSLTVDCSACRERTVVSAQQALRLALPSLHFPLLRRAPWSWMRCPACRQRTWVEVHVQL